MNLPLDRPEEDVDGNPITILVWYGSLCWLQQQIVLWRRFRGFWRINFASLVFARPSKFCECGAWTESYSNMRRIHRRPRKTHTYLIQIRPTNLPFLNAPIKNANKELAWFSQKSSFVSFPMLRNELSSLYNIVDTLICRWRGSLHVSARTNDNSYWIGIHDVVSCFPNRW